MMRRQTLLDSFSTPVFSGEWLMVAMCYRPYGAWEPQLSLRTPFFKARMTDYAAFEFEDTDAKGQALIRMGDLDHEGMYPQTPSAYLQAAFTHDVRVRDLDMKPQSFRAYCRGSGQAVEDQVVPFEDYATSLIAVRSATFKDIVKAAPPFLPDIFRSNGMYYEGFESALKSYLKVRLTAYKKGDAAPDLDWSREPVIKALLSAYALPNEHVHTALNPLEFAFGMLGAGVPMGQVVKSVMDGFLFCAMVRLNGVIPVECRNTLTYGSLKSMESILHRNIERAARADVKPWSL